MKKTMFFLIRMVMCILFIYLSSSTLAEEEITIISSGQCGDDVYYQLDSLGTLTISGTGSMNFRKYSTSVTYGPWYSWHDKIKTAVVEEGITSIPAYTFIYCSNLATVTIPEGVTYIGESAFEKCSSLTDITIPDSIARIYEDAFISCNNLENVYAGSLESWMGIVFIDPNNRYPEYQSADANPMKYAKNLYFNGELATEITIPQGITTIAPITFYSCECLTSVVIPESVTTIGVNAFAACNNLSSVVIPDSVTSIGYSAFNGCSRLTIINIPDSVTSIGIYVFGYCTNLSSISLPGSITSISGYAFYGCTNLRSVIIQDGITSIEDYAFEKCTNLSSLSIANTITSIGSDAFDSCQNLEAVYVESREAWFGISFDNVLANPTCYGANLYIDGVLNTIVDSGGCGTNVKYQLNDEGILTIYGSGKMQDNISLTSIPWRSKQTSITAVEIIKGVTSIGSYSFSGCSNLVKVTICDGLTAIGNGAFEDCSSLRYINIPNGVTSIGRYAFDNCSSLTNISLPESIISIETAAFENCSNLENINIPNGLLSINDYTFFGCSSFTSISIPTGVTSIGNYAFQHCSDLKYITIPATVQSIGNDAFRNSGIKYIEFLSNAPITFGTNVFSNGPIVYCHEFSDVYFWADDEHYEVVCFNNLDADDLLALDIPADCTLEFGKTIPVATTYFPSQGNPKIQWTSSAPEIVYVENGVITIMGVGKATITASCGDVTDTMVVTTYAEIESFDLSATEVWIVTTQTMQLSIENIQPAGASTSYSWKSSDTSTLRVDNNGMISARVPGDATIIVAFDNGVSRRCEVHVCYPVTSIAFEENQLEIINGTFAQLTANVTTRDQSYVNKLISFESSKPDVATVDANGKVSTHSVGTTTITASASSGVSASCTIIVRDLNTLVLPAGVKIIEDGAFDNTKVEAIELPEECEVIGVRAFADNAELVHVYMPDSITEIAANAFEGSEKVSFICESENAAAEYATKHNIPYLLK